jgi:SynChlorMet cassette protein ScmC
MPDSGKTYSVRLSSGRRWRYQPVQGTERWVERFSSFLGIDAGEDISSPTITILPSPDGVGQDIQPKPGAGRVPPDGISRQRLLRRWLPGINLYWQPGSQDILCVLRSSAGPDSELEQMRYALYPILDGAVCDGGLPLHAALVEREGVGILIAAASGVGKSTCCKRLPAPWNVLSDDMSLVVPAADGIWQAHPLPTWSAIKAREATWPCRLNESVPVAALFFLIRSETDGVERLGRGVSAIGIKDNASICFHYLDRYFHEAHHRPLRKKIFDNAVLLTERLPVYALRASLQGRFWEKIEEVLGQEAPLQGGIYPETGGRTYA